MKTADAIIHQFGLEPLPQEGGYFRRIFQHAEQLQSTPTRALASAIYYLLTPDTFSALHRLSCHESFHFHCGDPLAMLQLHPDEGGQLYRIGHHYTAGMVPFVSVPGGIWQGTRLLEGGQHGYALLSVVVTPEFLWEDFELGNRAELTAQYPEWANEIALLTRLPEASG